jgi:leucyl aminopeptidase
MRASFRQGTPETTDADTLIIGLFEGESAPGALDDALGGKLARLIDSGEAKGAFKKIATLHTDGAIGAARVIVAGFGKRDAFSAERARVVSAVAYGRARDASAKRIAWAVPDGGDVAATARAVTEGALLAAYRFDRYKSKSGDDDTAAAPQQLEVVAEQDLSDLVGETDIVVEHANMARDLQNLPANELTPTKLADHALSRAAEIDGLEGEAFGPDEIARRSMGGLLAVTKGSHEEPRFIVLRYNGGGPSLALVGKAVTFDTGGISLKPGAKMQEMKMDMSGASAAIEATAAIARLGLPVNLLCVVPSTENMPAGHATRPGDIITISNGKTVEVNNTDAEGRLILADGLVFSAAEGAERIIDLATLTGAIVTALGSTYAGLFSNDDDLSAAIAAAGDTTGELVWRMPLHRDYKDLTTGKVADLVNVSEARKASSAYAGSFLEEFVDGKPWAHLDIAGVAWDQDNRDYVGKGASGWGVRLLVELVRQSA